MSSANKKTKIYIFSILALGVLCAILRSISILLFYDGDIGYYSVGAVLPIISDVIFWICVIAAAVIPFFLFSKTETVGTINGAARYSALFPAVAFLLPMAEAIKALTLESKVSTVIILISSIASMIFFALLALSNDSSSTLNILCGTGVIVWLAMVWLRSYNDFFTTINSPEKLFFHFSCVATALIIVGELKALCLEAKKRSCFAYLSVGIITLFSFVFPDLLDRISGISTKSVSTLGETLVISAISVYAIARAISLLPKEEATECAVTDGQAEKAPDESLEIESEQTLQDTSKEDQSE